MASSETRELGSSVDGGVRFPVLTFSMGWVGTAKSVGDFRQCSRLAFRKGFHRQLRLVDSVGSSFRVVEVKKIRTIVSFTFRDFLELISGNPRWEIDVRFGPDGSS